MQQGDDCVRAGVLHHRRGGSPGSHGAAVRLVQAPAAFQGGGVATLPQFVAGASDALHVLLQNHQGASLSDPGRQHHGRRRCCRRQHSSHSVGSAQDAGVRAGAGGAIRRAGRAPSGGGGGRRRSRAQRGHRRQRPGQVRAPAPGRRDRRQIAAHGWGGGGGGARQLQRVHILVLRAAPQGLRGPGREVILRTAGRAGSQRDVDRGGEPRCQGPRDGSGALPEYQESVQALQPAHKTRDSLPPVSGISKGAQDVRSEDGRQGAYAYCRDETHGQGRLHHLLHRQHSRVLSRNGATPWGFHRQSS
mmetsp:Transcript_35383/g.67682  ORF Transcript_35383/g.67682 Transcript_35383/m.67682 type:complete len:304 (+) Transcript_35383:795-1706(+)